MKKKSIVFVNQYYLPEKNPPAKRMSAFAEYFVKNGWDVKVITANPNYPLGQFFKGYGFRYTKELINGVTVHRLPVIPSKNEGLVMRVLNYFSYALSIKVYKNLLRADVAFISSPPLFGAMTAHKIARKRGIPIVLDVRDLWPESIAGVGALSERSPVYKYYLKGAKNMYKESSLVIATTKRTEKDIQRMSKNKSTTTITNFADEKKLMHSSNNDNKIHVVFTGVTTSAQDLHGFLLKANTSLDAQNRFFWHIIGDGDQLPVMKETAKNKKWNNIKFYGYKSYEFCEKKIIEADLCLITLAQKEVFTKALPSKLFEYMSYNKPILNFWSKEVNDIIDKNNIGYAITKEKDIEKTMLGITKDSLKEKSINTKNVFNKLYTKDAVCKKVYEEVVKIL